MADDGKVPTRISAAAEVDAFLRRVAMLPPTGPRASGRRGRLLFAMDATASREPTWEWASRIQGEMFTSTAALGGLAVQLAFYRGLGEFRVAPWTTEADQLARLMSSVFCLAGETQIAKVLAHARNQARDSGLNALVFVGDCCEEEVDAIGARAGELALLGVPAFMFHEGSDPVAAIAFRHVARLTGGAYCRFDAGAADALRRLLEAVAVYAAGGRPALEHLAGRRGGEILAIAHQVSGRQRGEG